MSNRSFEAIADTTASTKRNPAAVGGVIASPQTKLTGLAIVSPLPINDEKIIELYQLKSPRKSFLTYVESGKDIEEGDLLLIGTETYIIKAIAKWGDIDQLVLEKVGGA